MRKYILPLLVCVFVSVSCKEEMIVVNNYISFYIEPERINVNNIRFADGCVYVDLCWKSSNVMPQEGYSEFYSDTHYNNKVSKWTYECAYNHVVACVSTLKNIKVSCVEKAEDEIIESNDDNIIVQYVSLEQYINNNYSDTAQVIFSEKTSEITDVPLPEDVFTIQIIPTSYTETIELVIESSFENNPITEKEISVEPLVLTIEINDGVIIYNIH